MAVDLSQYHTIEWDDETNSDGNLAHCMQAAHLGPNPERIVSEVLSEQPVEVTMRVRTGDFALAGPDRSRSTLWTIIFVTSSRRGDFLRPITGWRAEDAEIYQWTQGCRGGKVIQAWLSP